MYIYIYTLKVLSQMYHTAGHCLQPLRRFLFFATRVKEAGRVINLRCFSSVQTKIISIP